MNIKLVLLRLSIGRLKNLWIIYILNPCHVITHDIINCYYTIICN